nr:MAG TPA: hypothetical protein [Crassvirales sp.]
MEGYCSSPSAIRIANTPGGISQSKLWWGWCVVLSSPFIHTL